MIYALIAFLFGLVFGIAVGNFVTIKGFFAKARDGEPLKIQGINYWILNQDQIQKAASAVCKMQECEIEKPETIH